MPVMGIMSVPVLMLHGLVIMFVFVEIPLLGYLFAPERTSDGVRRFNTWLTDNAGQLATAALAVAGIYLTVRALVSAATSARPAWSVTSCGPH